MDPNQFYNALEIIRQLDPQIPASRVVLLLAIAMNEGSSQTEIAEITNIDKANVSRDVAMLGSYGYRNKRGLGLVSQSVDPENRRAFRLSLTALGKRLMKTFEAV